MSHRKALLSNREPQALALVVADVGKEAGNFRVNIVTLCWHAMWQLIRTRCGARSSAIGHKWNQRIFCAPNVKPAR